MAFSYSVLFAEIKAGCRAEWAILNHQYPYDKHLSVSVFTRLIGLYVLVACVLFLNEYLDQLLWWLTITFFPAFNDAFLLQDLLRFGVISLLYLFPAACYLLWVLRLSFEDMGFARFECNAQKNLMFVGLIAVILLLGFFDKERFSYRYFDGDLTDFLLWQSVYSLQIFAAEFFFRGVLLLVFARFFGLIAVPMMLIPYTMLFFDQTIGNCVCMSLIGLFFAWLTLRTGSIMLSLSIHIGAAWLVALWGA